MVKLKIKQITWSFRTALKGFNLLAAQKKEKDVTVELG